MSFLEREQDQLIPKIPLDSRQNCRMKIYTKTGDKGSSSLYSGERRGKDDTVFAALGDVDELNSVIGVAREYTTSIDATLGEQLEIIQSRLLDIGSAVATPIPSSNDSKLQRVAFDPTATSHLEEWIDAWTSELPALTQFILPSGGPAASFLHMSRSVCRRAERSVIPLARAGSTDEAVAVYLNRLSDYLFTVARVAAKKAGKPETVYKKA
jgi:ATP:cob(I)alamin adenosyltransferase